MKYPPFCLWGTGLMALHFLLLPALSLLPLSSLYSVRLLDLFSFIKRLSSNIWIFIHIKEWGTKILTGRCVKCGDSARSWFFHLGDQFQLSVSVCLSLWTAQLPQRNPPIFGCGSMSQAVRVSRLSKEGAIQPLVGYPLCRPTIPVFPVC